MPSSTRVIDSNSPEQTRIAGRDLGEIVEAGSIIAIDGFLGAGKSIFVRGIAEGLGVSDWRGSPTFNLVHEYRGRLPLYHLDAYRIGNAELVDLDFDAMLVAQGAIAIEWAQNVSETIRRAVPGRLIRIQIHDRGDENRKIEILG